MTAPLAWLADTNIVSGMMRPRPEPRVASFPDSIADDGLGIGDPRVSIDGLSCHSIATVYGGCPARHPNISGR